VRRDSFCYFIFWNWFRSGSSFFSGLGVTASLIGAVVGYLFLFIPGYLYKLFKGREGMGDGDMYLMGLIGSFLGVKSILSCCAFFFLCWSVNRYCYYKYL